MQIQKKFRIIFFGFNNNSINHYNALKNLRCISEFGVYTKNNNVEKLLNEKFKRVEVIDNNLGKYDFGIINSSTDKNIELLKKSNFFIDKFIVEKPIVKNWSDLEYLNQLSKNGKSIYEVNNYFHNKRIQNFLKKIDLEEENYIKLTFYKADLVRDNKYRHVFFNHLPHAIDILRILDRDILSNFDLSKILREYYKITLNINGFTYEINFKKNSLSNLIIETKDKKFILNENNLKNRLESFIKSKILKKNINLDFVEMYKKVFSSEFIENDLEYLNNKYQIILSICQESGLLKT